MISYAIVYCVYYTIMLRNGCGMQLHVETNRTRSCLQAPLSLAVVVQLSVERSPRSLNNENNTNMSTNDSTNTTNTTTSNS